MNCKCKKRQLHFCHCQCVFFTCSRVANVCHLCMKPTTFHFDGPGSENSSEIKINKNQNTLRKIFSIKAFYISCLRNHFSGCRCKDIFNKKSKNLFTSRILIPIFFYESAFFYLFICLFIYLHFIHFLVMPIQITCWLAAKQLFIFFRNHGS